MKDAVGAHVVEVMTPKKVLLDGVWLGAQKPKVAIVWVHGLGSSLFSKLGIMKLLVDQDTAVLSFNNRGHDKVASIRKMDGGYIRGGAAHEVFTECVDDIQGAVNFARAQGARRVYLAGHSTGCQKSAYYAAKRPRGVDGIVLLAPISDHSAERFAQGGARIAGALKVARRYLRAGKGHELVPETVWRWPWVADAQRLVSLYSGDGPEEIFTYWDAKRSPSVLEGIRVPISVVLAEKDEYADRAAVQIRDWFAEHLKPGDRVMVVPRVPHGFSGGEKAVANEIRKVIRGTSSTVRSRRAR